MAEDLQSRGHTAHPCRFVLDEAGSGEKLLEETLARFGRLDILVNNALSRPTLPPLPLERLSYQQLQAGVTANLTNVLHLTASAHSHLRETRGSVLNIGSAVVNRHIIGLPLYGIVKEALAQLTRVLAAEWASDGIRVNQINPGVVQTEIVAGKSAQNEERRLLFEDLQGRHPLGRFGEPDEIGELACFMVSSSASWMTGTIINLDGGYSIQGLLGRARATPPAEERPFFALPQP